MCSENKTPTGFTKSLYLSKRFSENVRIGMKACQILLASVFTCERSTPGMIRIHIHIANLLDHHNWKMMNIVRGT